MGRARWLLEWQRSVGIAMDQELHAWLMSWDVLADGVAVFYVTALLAAVIGTACWLAACRPAEAYVQFRTRFALAQTLTVLVYLAFPVAPLRMIITSSGTTGADWSRSIQYEFAAMPSGHVVFALLVGAAVWRHATPRWRWVGFAHPLATAVVVGATAHHLLVDVIAAVGLSVVAAPTVAAWHGRRTVPAGARWRPCAAPGHLRPGS
jgi:hypothetical protein